MTAWKNFFFMVGIVCLQTQYLYSMISTLNRNDPYPVYTTADPHTLLTRNYRQELKDCIVFHRGPRNFSPFAEHPISPARDNPYNIKPEDPNFDYRNELKECISYGPDELFRISATLFRQRASVGTDFWNRKYRNLGNLQGNWNTIALLYPEANGNIDTQTLLGDTFGLNSLSSQECFQRLINPINADSLNEFGFLSVPILYRKFGARFQLEVALGCNFGLRIEAGVSDIRQTVTLVDLTCSATGLTCPSKDCLVTCTEDLSLDVTLADNSCTPANCCIDVFDCACKRLVLNNYTKQIYKLADTLGLNIRNFHKTSAEDTRFFLFWRKPYEINFQRVHLPPCGWAAFIITPFAVAQFSAPTGRKKCQTALFDLPNGNDGHWSYGFDLGFNIDWIETVGLSFEGGMTKFNERCYSNVPVPTSQFQAGLFPARANLFIEPGTNWNLGITLDAYHFICDLSFWGQYVMVDHSPDCIRVASSNTPTSNLDIAKMREQSEWRVHLANIALNYDISPNIALGFLWQAPIKQYNAYQSTTIMGSIVITW